MSLEQPVQKRQNDRMFDQRVAGQRLGDHRIQPARRQPLERITAATRRHPGQHRLPHLLHRLFIEQPLQNDIAVGFKLRPQPVDRRVIRHRLAAGGRVILARIAGVGIVIQTIEHQRGHGIILRAGTGVSPWRAGPMAPTIACNPPVRQ
jgi:5-formyltetrahydrofolate cyclo-ligase